MFPISAVTLITYLNLTIINYIYIICPANERADIPPHHPAIKSNSTMTGCRVGMCRKTDFGRPVVHSLAGQSIVYYQTVNKFQING